ncbi:SCO family protein [Halobacillus massiliensis]|uniref:SCO family protein n=1 Tax=Halobacillus massiliensis TaxID=1926286 RepID=UPI0009E2A29C|nr:SCO family protein [Halobacillus massiliensis]
MSLHNALKLILVITSFLFLASCGQKELEEPLEWEIGNIEGTTQSNEDFAVEDMEGKVWIADFIFTSCNTVCPPMTRNMSQLQKEFKEQDIDVEFVSFSVDPEVDTPEKLNEFAEAHGADLDNWTFVTGYEQNEIEQYGQESFRSVTSKPEGADQVTHGSSFFLVSQDQQIMKYYNGDKDVPYEQIVEDAEILLNQ